MKRVLKPLLLLAIFLSAAAAGLLLDLPAFLQTLLVRIDNLGWTSSIVFVLLYIVITVLLIPGSILTLGAGAVFGVLRGTVLVSIGSTLGASAAFLIGRSVLRDWTARRAAENPRFRAIDEAIGREGARIVFLLRLSPLVPFNLSNYIYSAGRISLLPYMLASWLGMLPGTLVYVYIGSVLGSLTAAVAGQAERTPAEWVLFGIGLGATLLVSLLITRAARRALQHSSAGQAAIPADTDA